MTFKDFVLLEYKSRSQKMPESNAINLLKTRCSDIVKLYKENPEIRLYRGIGALIASPATVDNFLFVDPGSQERIPKGMDWNIIYPLLDAIPEWHQFPSRKNSIMFSTNEKAAEFFATKNQVFVGFPFNGNRLGISPTQDFNYTAIKINNEIFSIVDIAHMLKTYVEVATDDWHGTTRIEDIMKADKILKDLEKQISVTKKVIMYENIRMKSDIILHFHILLKRYGFFNALKKIFGPQNLGFSFASNLVQLMNAINRPEGPTKKISKEDMHGGKEVWTDGPVILVRMNKLKDTFNQI